MNEIGSHRDIPELPDDLRSWIEPAALVPLVLEAVQEAARTTEGPSTLASGTPRALLGVLIYAYAVRLYGADEIERQIRVDPQLRYLAARSFPTAQQLRQFRRAQRDRVHRSLRALLQKAWRIRVASLDSAWARDPRGLDARFDQAAKRRIEAALLADSMAMDV